ncbi:MAG: response regulator [Synechococcales cyanobacterium CRU_2_2]|nr:response regulator [Synechococcales cyanobacterium CRU_2_2]
MSKLTILCVDDETIILNSLRRQLKQAFQDAYLYEGAESADEAFEIIEELAEDGSDVIVIVSDWLMPGMKGDEFLCEVNKRFPHVVKILLTGQADESAIERAKTEANLHKYLAKPWDAQELTDCIRSGLEHLALESVR